VTIGWASFGFRRFFGRRNAEGCFQASRISDQRLDCGGVDEPAAREWRED
jgi:hypothetical protein